MAWHIKYNFNLPYSFLSWFINTPSLYFQYKNFLQCLALMNMYIHFTSLIISFTKLSKTPITWILGLWNSSLVLSFFSLLLFNIWSPSGGAQILPGQGIKLFWGFVESSDGISAESKVVSHTILPNNTVCIFKMLGCLREIHKFWSTILGDWEGTLT